MLGIAGADTTTEATVALVQIATGQFGARTHEILDDALCGIEDRRDCSDFTMLPVLRNWLDHRDTLEAPLRERIKAAILGYRYWMSEPGNDAMWFWSENHVLCFHVSQLVAGHMFPGETFANSGRSGADLSAEALDRLHRWFDGIERDGLCEWNSAAYYPIDMLALLSLHDMSPDPELRRRSAALLDRIFVMTGLHMIGGTPAGAQGRSYEKELLSGPLNELGAVGVVAFGGTWYPGFGRAALSLCLSNYEPPAEAARLATPREGEVIEARYFQGAGEAAKLSLWKTRHAQLSTVSDHMTGHIGKQQHLLDVQFAAHPFARLWINHPGDRKPWSGRRPSKLAGNHWLPHVAQHGRSAFAIYNIPEDARFVPFTQVFAIAEGFDAIEPLGAHMLLYRCGGCTAVVRCSAPLMPETSGPYRNAAYRANALRSGWLLRLEETPERADHEAFKASVMGEAFSFDSQALRLKAGGYSLTHDGCFCLEGETLEFDWPGPEPHIPS